MSEQSSSRSLPFKSKKKLIMDSPSSKPKTSVSLPTPERPPPSMFTRSKNGSAALSIKEIRQAAGSRPRSENVSSARSLLFNDDSSSSSVSKRTSTNKDKLLEKYENLSKFFDALDSSIVLSRLRGTKPTFTNISGQIERLTERRFCYGHLAQLKHVLPEAIEIKRVLVYNETTSCMKPDLHVTLNADAVEFDEKSKSESKKVSLRKVFRSRLAAFAKTHPQGDDVPEEPLPELYSTRKPDEVIKSVGSVPIAKLVSSPIKVASTPVKPVSTSLDETLSTPAKVDSASAIAAATPPEFASTPARSFSASLAAPSKKQTIREDTVQDDDVSTEPPTKLARRSLLSSLDIAKDENDDLNILPDTLRQALIEQEREAIAEKDPAISLAKRRRKMIAALPKLFNVVHFLIQSIKRWVITKEELVHKILAGHTDIADRREVEEQLVLMKELVPEWISEKRSSCGDVLVCFNKMTSPLTIRKSLEEESKKAMATPLA